MNRDIARKLEIEGCKTFVCPNLGLLDEKGKELLLKDETIQRAKDLAIRYFKDTYQRPHYSSVKHVLPAFIHIASVLEGDRRSQSDIAKKFNVSAITIRKWNVDIIETLKIKMVRNGKKVRQPLIDSNGNFICPNLDLISETGKTLGLRDSTIERAKDLAIQYFKKTYLNPRYWSAKIVLPAFIYLASILENEKIRQIDICMVLDTSGTSISIWCRDIVATLGLKIIYLGDGRISVALTKDVEHI